MKGDSLKIAAEAALKTLTDASNQAIKTIAEAASQASKVVSANAATAANVVNTAQSGDHDLLIKLETKVDGLREDIKDITARDDKFVLKEDYIVWRNLLIVGLLGSIAIGVLSRLFLK